MIKITIRALLLCTAIDLVFGHGRLMEPPGRSSMWRFPDDPEINPYLDIVEPNYNDNQLFCGGFQHQQSLGGKCGICGDPYDGVRENEAGGKYGKGIIVRQYDQGDVFQVKIEITAHHMGYFEFRLCPWDNPTVPASQECLDQYLLGNPVDTKWYLPPPNGGSSDWYTIDLKLPDGVTCTQCILQWRYHTGNNWGCDEDGSCGEGLGPQEEFYGCADISIGTSSIPTPPGQTDGSTSTTVQTQTTTASASTTTSTTAPTSSSSAAVTSATSNPGNPDDPCQGQTGYVIKDCTSFYQCTQGNSDPYVFDCPPGTVFNSEKGACDYAYNTPPPCGTKE